MSVWKSKRFWTNAEVAQNEDGFSVILDGRSVKTPAKAALILPTQALAQAIAQEWAAQEDIVDPLSMPYTRSANAAIDKVGPQKTEVADMIAAYGDADLLCYRAEGPDALVARQAAQWDPVLAWAAQELSAPLKPVSGLIHTPQDADALAVLSRATHALNNFQLAAFHDLVSLSGSLIVGFAVARDHISPQNAWTLSRLDELWQQEQWGEDDEAQAAAIVKEQAFLHAKRFFDAVDTGKAAQ